MANDLKAHGALRVVQIPLGVDLAHFHPSRRADAAQTRALIGLPADAPVIGFVGRFAREKEVDVLVEAWETIEQRTDAYLALVGDGPARRRLRAHSRGSRVIWIPYQHDRNQLANVLAALDIFVSPGSIETFGLSALEAAASATPVISADRGGVSEQIRQSGGGALFESGDPGALAEVAVRMLQTPSEWPRLGALGRAYAEREHSWSRVFDRIFDVYRRVVA
jgi:glycosyltransferase involved in cell wall biosynthesis